MICVVQFVDYASFKYKSVALESNGLRTCGCLRTVSSFSFVSLIVF